MRASIRLAQRASDELTFAFEAAGPVWRDGQARYYKTRLHDPAVAALDTYIRAAERLLEALQEAEDAG